MLDILDSLFEENTHMCDDITKKNTLFSDNEVIVAGVSFSEAKQLIQRFLTKKRIVEDKNNCSKIVEPMTKEELAKKIGIEPEEFKKFDSPIEYKKIDQSVIFCLNGLDCCTHWETDKKEIMVNMTNSRLNPHDRFLSETQTSPTICNLVLISLS
jgi:hypothetical protein